MASERTIQLNKKKVVEQIQSYLAGELSSLLPAAEAAESASRELEVGTAQRIREIQQQLVMYKFLPLREYGAEDVVCPSSLVELDLAGRRAYCLVVPSGGGLVMQVEGSPVQVVTPQSPLGEALLGRRVGDTIQVAVAGKTREYRIISMV